MADGLEPLLQRTGDTPAEFAGRLLGFGQAEMRAGVPKWAWFGVGMVAGATFMLLYGDRVRRFVGR